jgi:hypothetical protein
VFAVAGSAAYPINRRSFMLAFPSDVTQLGHAKRVATIFVWPSICRQVEGPIVRGRYEWALPTPTLRGTVTARRRNQAAAGSLPKMSDRADNSRVICPSVPTVIRR